MFSHFYVNRIPKFMTRKKFAFPVAVASQGASKERNKLRAENVFYSNLFKSNFLKPPSSVFVVVHPAEKCFAFKEI